MLDLEIVEEQEYSNLDRVILLDWPRRRAVGTTRLNINHV